MLSILAADETTARRLSQEEGIDFPASCMVAREGERTVGYVLYREDGDQICLLYALADSGPVLDGLLRGAMNAAYLKGCRRAVCRSPALFPALEALRFSKTEEGYVCYLTEFFHRPCTHG